MVLQTSGPLKFSQLQNEFCPGTISYNYPPYYGLKLSNFYTNSLSLNTFSVPGLPVNNSVPIKFSQFYNKSTFTNYNLYSSNLNIYTFNIINTTQLMLTFDNSSAIHAFKITAVSDNIRGYDLSINKYLLVSGGGASTFVSGGGGGYINTSLNTIIIPLTKGTYYFVTGFTPTSKGYNNGNVEIEGSRGGDTSILKNNGILIKMAKGGGGTLLIEEGGINYYTGGDSGNTINNNFTSFIGTNYDYNAQYYGGAGAGATSAPTNYINGGTGYLSTITGYNIMCGSGGGGRFGNTNGTSQNSLYGKGADWNANNSTSGVIIIWIIRDYNPL